MERRLVNPHAEPDGSGCTDAKFLLGRTAEKRKRVHPPAGMGGKEPRKPQLCRMAEGNFSELFGRTQAKKGNFGFLASERQKENFRVTFPGEARRWRKEILRAETVPGVVDIYIHTIHSYAF